MSCFQYCVQFTINMDVVFMNSKCGACSKHLMVSCKILNLPEILIMSFDLCIETWEEMQMQCYFRQVPSLFILFYKVKVLLILQGSFHDSQ